MELKLTTRSQEALASAASAAVAGGHPQVVPAHLLVALLEQQGGVAGALLAATAGGPAVDGVLRRARELVTALPSASGSTVATPSSPARRWTR